MEFTDEEKEYIKKYEEKFHVLTNEEKEYIAKYEEKYGKLSEEGKKHVLKHRNSLSEEELDEMLEEWIGK